MGMPAGGLAVTAHTGAHLGFLRIHSKYATGTQIKKAVATSANSGAASILPTMFYDQKAIAREGEILSGVGATEPDKVRGHALTSFAGLIHDYSQTSDIGELRKSVNDVQIQAGKDTSVKVIQAAAYTQALNAKTESTLAYKSAHDRYSADFIENLNGKIDEKMGGAKWIGVGQMVTNAGKELIDARAALKSLSGAAAAVGPAVGVALVALDAVLSIHDWWAKAKLQKAKAKMTSEFKSLMDGGEKATLASIQSHTDAEVKIAAKGQARSGVGMVDYANKLALGQSAEPPAPTSLDKMSGPQLNEFYTNMLSNPGEAHSTLFGMYLAGISVKGNQMWNRFETEIDDMGGTWKP